MKKMLNRTLVEGYLYENGLELRKTGENSKNPGTEYIRGKLDVATDDALTNVVSVNFTYVTATTSKGTANATFTVLKQIIDGELKTVMGDGVENAAKVRIDSAIGLNDFYTDRNGQEELVSAKRNEGGFVHTVAVLNEDEKQRNTFDCDILITGVRIQEANPERELPEKAIVKCATFDFRGSLLPIELSVVNPNAIAYFEGLGASSSNPVFTRVRGRQVSETLVRKIEEETPWGEVSVREVSSSRRDWVITWAQGEPYEWDTPETITVNELKEAMANREVYLAGVKQRNEEYKALKNQPTPVAAGAFNF